MAAKLKLQTVAGNYTKAKENYLGGETFGGLQRELGEAKKRFESVEQKCVTKVLHSAEVIVCTCIGAGSDIIRSFASKELIRFSTVLVDEAAQCMESATLPTLVMGCERLILIGYSVLSNFDVLLHYFLHYSLHHSLLHFSPCISSSLNFTPHVSIFYFLFIYFHPHLQFILSLILLLLLLLLSLILILILILIVLHLLLHTLL